MDCIVVGGPAGGVILKDVRPDAQWIELKRPDYIKPLSASYQKRPEYAMTSAKYEIHPISLVNTGEHKPNLFAIGVVEGCSLTWAMEQLVKGYCQDLTRQLLDEGIITKN